MITLFVIAQKHSYNNFGDIYNFGLDMATNTSLILLLYITVNNFIIKRN